MMRSLKITLSYKIITLVYAHPKYVSIILGCVCRCGYMTTNSFQCPKYGRIHVECKTCHEKGTIILDRLSVKHFHLTHFPLVSGDIDKYLDGWEADQMKNNP